MAQCSLDTRNRRRVKLRYQSVLDDAECSEAHPKSIAFWAVLKAYQPAVSALVVALMVTLGQVC